MYGTKAFPGHKPLYSISSFTPFLREEPRESACFFPPHTLPSPHKDLTSSPSPGHISCPPAQPSVYLTAQHLSQSLPLAPTSLHTLHSASTCSVHNRHRLIKRFMWYIIKLMKLNLLNLWIWIMKLLKK